MMYHTCGGGEHIIGDGPYLEGIVQYVIVTILLQPKASIVTIPHRRYATISHMQTLITMQETYFLQ